MTSRCMTCDRPEATPEQWRDMEAEEGPDLCWGDPECRYNAVDWRAEAMEARRSLCALLDGHLSPSDAVRQSAISAAMETRKGWGMCKGRAPGDAEGEASRSFIDDETRAMLRSITGGGQ